MKKKNKQKTKKKQWQQTNKRKDTRKLITHQESKLVVTYRTNRQRATIVCMFDHYFMYCGETWLKETNQWLD